MKTLLKAANKNGTAESKKVELDKPKLQFPLCKQKFLWENKHIFEEIKLKLNLDEIFSPTSKEFAEKRIDAKKSSNAQQCAQF